MTQDQNRCPRCPISSIIKLISGKWTVEIMRELAIKPMRTRQFLAHIPGLTMKCLQERLRALESAGMITRTKYEEKIPRVDHHITERGKRLLDIFVLLRELQAEMMDVNCVCPIELARNQEMNSMPIEGIDFDCPTRR